MTIHTVNLKKLTAWGSFALVTLALSLPVTLVQAGEMILKGRDVFAAPERTWVKLDQDEKRGIGTFQLNGLAFLEDGQIGTIKDTGAYESNKGLRAYLGYYFVTFSDGSTLMEKYQGTAKPGEKTTAHEGTLTYIGGTGRFEGVKGEGTFTGTGYSNGMSIFDWEAKATVPD